MPATYRNARTSALVLLATLLLLSSCAGPLLNTKPIVKIGLVTSFEGLGREAGYDTLHGLKLAIAECNAAGGAGGHMIELVALDHSNDPRQAKAQAARMAADPLVVAVVAGGSETAAAEIPAYRDLGLPVIIPWSVPAELIDPEAGIVTIAVDSSTAASELGKILPQNSATLVIAKEYPTHLITNVLPSANHAFPPTSWTQVNVDAWAGQVLAHSGKTSSTIVLSGPEARAGQILTSLEQAGRKGNAHVGPDASGPLLAATGGTGATDIFILIPAPAGRDLSAPPDTPGSLEELGPRGVLSYDAAWLLLTAIEIAAERGGKPDRKSVMKSLADVRNVGLTGDVSLQGGHRESPSLWLYQMRGGTYPGKLLQKIQP
jgi:ABC-type branched-subunit amino acid transport system substrate-binding protein